MLFVAKVHRTSDMRIDTHQHFWVYNERDYEWLGRGMDSLKRDWLPADLESLLKSAGVDGTIAVQARQKVEETQFLLKLSDERAFIKGVVGWVELCSPMLELELEQFCYHPKLRGVRHPVHDEPDDEFMLRQDFVRGIGRLRQYNLAYDLIVFPRHLATACKLVAEFPEQTFVLDHMAKPRIRDGRIEPWHSDIKRLAEFQNVSCKISGMVTEADWESWKRKDFFPYMDIVLEVFGAERVMVGSDWPVCTLAAEYEQVIEIAAEFIQQLSPDEQSAIWAQNAVRIYQLPA